MGGNVVGSRITDFLLLASAVLPMSVCGESARCEVPVTIGMSALPPVPCLDQGPWDASTPCSSSPSWSATCLRTVPVPRRRRRHHDRTTGHQDRAPLARLGLDLVLRHGRGVPLLLRARLLVKGAICIPEAAARIRQLPRTHMHVGPAAVRFDLPVMDTGATVPLRVAVTGLAAASTCLVARWEAEAVLLPAACAARTLDTSRLSWPAAPSTCAPAGPGEVASGAPRRACKRPRRMRLSRGPL